MPNYTCQRIADFADGKVVIITTSGGDRIEGRVRVPDEDDPFYRLQITTSGGVNRSMDVIDVGNVKLAPKKVE